MKSNIRIGTGFDVHRLVEGRKLILGGVEIPHHLGLDGHSDADVLLHAISDALLGALALGDIGKHFPDTDPEYKNADSRELLRKVVALISENGYGAVNIDATIVAQKPKLAPYIKDMRGNIAKDTNLDIEAVNVKATTSEGLGFEGKEQGVSAQAVVLVQKQ